MRVDAESPIVRLADYQPPAFLADSVELTFRLDPGATRVVSRIDFRRNPAHPSGADLRLDGRNLKLVSARLDAAARLILRDRELARDAVQDAFIRAWRDLRGLRDPERFDAWLHRLTVHACLDIARRRKRRVQEVELTPITPAFQADSATHLADRELLDDALRRLDPEWRAVVVLHYYLGMPLPEVATELRIPLGTAKSRLHRSLGVMRASILESGVVDLAPVREGQLA